MNTKEIGIAGKQPTLWEPSSPLPYTPDGEEGVPVSSDSLIGMSSFCSISYRLFRPVPLLARRIAISPRHEVQSNCYTGTRGGERKREAGSSDLSPKLEYTNRNQIVSDR